MTLPQAIDAYNDAVEFRDSPTGQQHEKASNDLVLYRMGQMLDEMEDEE